MTEKLKPCPFCGGEAEKVILGMHSHSHQAIIFCKESKHECGSSGTWNSRGGEKEALEAAIKAWNTRADMHTELVEALRPLVSSHHNDDKCQCNNCIGHRVLLKATKEG